jgi:peptide subunit release factor 1 (eRF1)
VVLADRTGADFILSARGDDGDVESVDLAAGNDPHLRKSQPGGWSQRRYQNRAENLWDHNAKQVADQVTELVDKHRARLVLVAGDVRALEKLGQHLPERVAGLVRELETGGRAPGTDVDELADEVVKMVATAVAEDSVDLLRTFKQERGQHDLATEGVAATLAALASAQVDTLLVHDDPDDARTAWFGPGPGMVGEDAQTLRDLGVESPEEGRLVDVAIRAAFTTGAAVRMIPSVRSVAEGLGAVLRF